MNLRQYARGKPCMVRIGGVCNHDPETTVLAHPNGNKSLSSKNADFLGSWACSDCHDVYDGRQNLPLGMESWEVDVAFSEGVRRTQQELLKAGLDKVIENWARGLKL